MIDRYCPKLNIFLQIYCRTTQLSSIPNSRTLQHDARILFCVGTPTSTYDLIRIKWQLEWSYKIEVINY